MFLIQQAQLLFSQLQHVVQGLAPHHYWQPIHHLSGATIGQHVRHTIELYLELIAGYPQGIIHYGKRKRDPRIESDPQLAIEKINYILDHLPVENKKLTFIGDDDAAMTENNIATNYFRELAYNIDHTIHHMALVRVALVELEVIAVPEEFGVAPSTLKYRRACVQ